MIGAFKKKSNLPEYLSHYGMHRAPFSSDIEEDMFYADPVRQQRLNVLLHLTQNTNELLVLIGEEGIGKTTFVDQFQKNAAEHWRLCFINGHKTLTEEQFLHFVSNDFKIAQSSTNRGTLLSQLRKHLEQMLEEAIPVILVIDDAHELSTGVLSLVLNIASIKNTRTGGSVRVILAAEPNIKIMLAEPELDDAHDLIVRKIDLPPFDESHTGDYLHHRLTRAGMEVEKFLTKPTVRKIFKTSAGIPGRINEAADKLLFDTTPVIRRHSHIQSAQKSSGMKRIALLIVVTILITLAGLFLYIYLNETQGTAETPDRVQESVTPLKLPAIDSLPNKNDNEESTQASTDPVDPMQLLKEELAEKVAPAQDNASKPAAEKTESAEPPAGESQSPKDDKEKPDIKDNAWVLAQKESDYTLQLVAGRQKQTISNFINKYQLSDNLIYFSSKRNGKTWHNLSYGIYPDRQSADQALQNLPASLSDIKPWIRKFGSIQAEIRHLNPQ